MPDDISVYDEDRYCECDYDEEYSDDCNDDDDAYCDYVNTEARYLNEWLRFH